MADLFIILLLAIPLLIGLSALLRGDLIRSITMLSIAFVIFNLATLFNSASNSISNSTNTSTSISTNTTITPTINQTTHDIAMHNLSIAINNMLGGGGDVGAQIIQFGIFVVPIGVIVIIALWVNRSNHNDESESQRRYRERNEDFSEDPSEREFRRIVSNSHSRRPRIHNIPLHDIVETEYPWGDPEENNQVMNEAKAHASLPGRVIVEHKNRGACLEWK